MEELEDSNLAKRSGSQMSEKSGALQGLTDTEPLRNVSQGRWV
jgi:hypothetical protein